jgi:hypothetical protein
MSSLRYAGSISIPVEITPRPQDTNGCIAIDNLHCTMLLPSQLRVLKELVGLSNMGLRQWVEGVIEQIADPPMLVLGSETHIATRIDPSWEYDNTTCSEDIKRTHFIEVLNQEEMQAWLNTLTDALLLPNVERFFHVSVANGTGKPTDSIGDINGDDL